MSNEKVIYLSKMLELKTAQDDTLPADSLALISAFMEIRPPEDRRAVIAFCEQVAQTDRSKPE